MARTTEKLSALKIPRLKKPGLYHDGGGLYLQVGTSGTKSWIYRFMLDGRQRDMGLGSFPTIGLADARIKASTYRKLKQDGIDPIDARKSERQRLKLEAAKAVTFKDAATKYVDAYSPTWRNKVHSQQWTRTLEDYAYPVFGSFAVQAIDVALVMKALDPIWHTKTETASRVRQRIEAVLDWATARGYRKGENPARSHETSGQNAAPTIPSPKGSASTGAALHQHGCIHRYPKAPERDRRAGIGISDPDGQPHG